MRQVADVAIVPSPRLAPMRSGHPVLGGAFIAIQFLALNAVGLFATAYIIRRLGPLHYGEWATAAALASAHLVMTNAGLRTLFVRNVAQRSHDAGDLLAVQLALRMGLGIVAGCCALTTSVVLGYPAVVVACTAVGCLWIVLSVTATTLGDVLQSLEQFGTYSATALVAGIAVTVSSVVAVSLGCGPVGLAIAYLTAPVVSTVLCWRSVRRSVDVRVRWDTARARSLLRDARLVALNQVAGAVRDRAEQLLVPRLVGLESFGLFSAGSMIGDRLANVPDAICTAFYPRISRSAHERFHGPLADDVAAMLSVGLASALPVAIVGCYLAESLASVLLPTATEACRGVIQVTVWAVPIAAMSLCLSFALQAAGHHESVARVGLRATAVSAATSAALIAVLGITGASWAVVLRPASLVLALLPTFTRTFPGVLAHVPFGRMLFCAAGLEGVCLAGERTQLWSALVFASIAVCAYGLALLITGVFPMRALMRLIAPPLHDVPVHVKS